MYFKIVLQRILDRISAIKNLDKLFAYRTAVFIRLYEYVTVPVADAGMVLEYLAPLIMFFKPEPQSLLLTYYLITVYDPLVVFLNKIHQQFKIKLLAYITVIRIIISGFCSFRKFAYSFFIFPYIKVTVHPITPIATVILGISSFDQHLCIVAVTI